MRATREHGEQRRKDRDKDGDSVDCYALTRQWLRPRRTLAPAAVAAAVVGGDAVARSLEARRSRPDQDPLGERQSRLE